MACLRKIEGVAKGDKLRNSEIQIRLKWKHDVIQRIQQRRLKFFGHVVRISNDRFPHIPGRPKNRGHFLWLVTLEILIRSASNLAYIKVISFLTLNRNLFESSLEKKVAPSSE